MVQRQGQRGPLPGRGGPRGGLYWCATLLPPSTCTVQCIASHTYPYTLSHHPGLLVHLLACMGKGRRQQDTLEQIEALGWAEMARCGGGGCGHQLAAGSRRHRRLRKVE